MRKPSSSYKQKGTIQHTVALERGVKAYSFCLYREFLMVGTDRDILLFDPETSQLVGSFNAHRASVSAITFCTETGIVWTADRSGEIALWEIQVRATPTSSPSRVLTADVKGLSIQCVGRRREQTGQKLIALVPWRGDRIWSIAQDHVVIWDAIGQKPVQELDIANNKISCCVSLDHSRAILAHRGGKIEVYTPTKTM
jgi:WD40 repeat protein